LPYAVGETVKGVVSGITDYGAFVQIDNEVNGMIHISKISRNFIKDIRSVIKIGDEVTATVISNTEGKIGLSLIGETKKPAVIDFEAMLSAYKTVSEENLAGINSRNKKKRR